MPLMIFSMPAVLDYAFASCCHAFAIDAAFAIFAIDYAELFADAADGFLSFITGPDDFIFAITIADYELPLR